MKILQMKTIFLVLMAISIMLCCCEFKNVKVIYDESLLMGFELDLSEVEVVLIKGSKTVIEPIAQEVLNNEKQLELAVNVKESSLAQH